MIVSGNTNIEKIYYNGYAISKIYACNDEVVWTGDTPTPPTGTSKLTYHTTSGDTYVIPCDGSPSLTLTEMINSMDEHGIATRPLYNYAVASAEVGDCVNTLGETLFDDMFSLSSVTIPNNITTIGHSVFKNIGISAITIPSSVTSLGEFAFEGCEKLVSIDIPSSITSINQGTFMDNIRLMNITLPSTITSIDDDAFYLPSYEVGDSRRTYVLRAITGRTVTMLATTPPTIGSGVFGYGGSESCTYPIYVPAASVSAYQSAWSVYANRIQAIPNS